MSDPNILNLVEGEFVNWSVDLYTDLPPTCVILSCTKQDTRGDKRRVYFLCRTKEEYDYANCIVTFDHGFDPSKIVIAGKVPESWSN